MRMWVVFVSLLVCAIAAPLDGQNEGSDLQQDEEKVNLVKRAQEFMMFGNQQNNPNTKDKRAEVAESSDDTIDKQGEIVAEPPVDIEPEQEQGVTSNLETEVEIPPPEELPVDGNMGVEDPLVSSEDAGSEEEMVQQPIEEQDGDDDSDAVDDDDDVDDVDSEANEVGMPMGDAGDSEEVAEESPEAYEKFLSSYGQGDDGYLMNLLSSQYDRLGPSYPSSYNLYNYLTGGRYRRSRPVPSIHANSKSRILKRARRIKRDLYFTSDILGRKYDPYTGSRFAAINPYEEEEPEVDEDDIRYLVNLLANAEDYEDDDYTGYDNELPYPEYYEPEVDLGASEFYVPKRQAGLTFVPGIKRSRDFYPYALEPESHFAAFTPGKRNMEDYAEAYQRLMELAAELPIEDYYRRK